MNCVPFSPALPYGPRRPGSSPGRNRPRGHILAIKLHKVSNYYLLPCEVLLCVDSSLLSFISCFVCWKLLILNCAIVVQVWRKSIRDYLHRLTWFCCTYEEVWPPHWLGKCPCGTSDPRLLEEDCRSHPHLAAKSYHEFGLCTSAPNSMKPHTWQTAVPSSSITVSRPPFSFSYLPIFCHSYFLSWRLQFSLSIYWTIFILTFCLFGWRRSSRL